MRMSLVDPVETEPEGASSRSDPLLHASLVLSSSFPSVSCLLVLSSPSPPHSPASFGPNAREVIVFPASLGVEVALQVAESGQKALETMSLEEAAWPCSPQTGAWNKGGRFPYGHGSTPLVPFWGAPPILVCFTGF